MEIAGYSWQLLTTSPSACGPIQSTDYRGVLQISFHVSIRVSLLLGQFWTLICICHYLTSSSSSLQGIAKASFVSALASFVVPFSHDARIAPSFIRDFCCMIAAYSGRYPFTNSGDIRSVRWWSSVSLAKLILFSQTLSWKTKFHCFMHDSVQTSLCNKLTLEHIVPVWYW